MSNLTGICLALVWLVVATCRARANLHQQMSPQQLQSVFHVSTVEDVPDYEVVKLSHHNFPEESAKSLTISKVSLNAFGKNYNLTLKPTYGLFKNGQVHEVPMYYVNNKVNATHGFNLQSIEDDGSHTRDNVGEVFQDEDNQAAILLRRNKEIDDLVMEGTVNNEIVIKPLPDDLAPNQNESLHIVYKTEPKSPDDSVDFALLEPDDSATTPQPKQTSSGRRKRSLTNEDMAKKQPVPPIVYVETAVFVDYDFYVALDKDTLKIKRYLLSFWNAVDLRYRSLSSPKIRICLVDIKIMKTSGDTEYLVKNRVDGNAVNAGAALTDLSKHLYHAKNVPANDVVVVMTGLDLCMRNQAGGQCNRATAGYAYIGGVCKINKQLEKYNSIAIVEDSGSFSGILVAAHEMGHLLGASHDGSPGPNNFEASGGIGCKFNDGYIMSDVRRTERCFRWSTCSAKSIYQYLNSGNAVCLYNKPYQDLASGAPLPGTEMSVDEQCQKTDNGTACFKDEKVCVELFCLAKGMCHSSGPAAEGSPCGDNKHCLEGKCVSSLTNDIPN